MAELQYVSTLAGGPASVVSLEILETAGGPVLQGYTASGSVQGTWALGGGAATPTGTADPGSAYSIAGLSLGFSQATYGLSDDQFARIAEGGGLTVALNGDPFSGMRVESLWLDGGGATGWLFVEDPAGGLSRFDISSGALQGGGTLSLAPVATAVTGPVDDLLYFDTGASEYLVTVSTEADGIALWQVDAAGTLSAAGQAAPGVGIDAPTAVAAATVDGSDYLVVAAAGSGSLSVFEITTSGGLTLADHVLDDTTATRFRDASVLEMVEYDGRVYLFAAGSDQGISVLTLLPGGRLVHLASLADDAALTLDSVSAITAAVVGGEIQVFVTSGSEAGVTQLVFDPGPAGSVETGGSAADTLTGGTGVDILTGNGGNDVLNGGAGDDILTDGTGADTMTGGAGADLFVLTADGTRDTILDYDPAEDRLDLSGFRMFYGVGQLQIVPTAQGATLIFGDEEIEIRSADFMPLSAADFSDLTVRNLDRPPQGGFTARTRIEGTEGDDLLFGTEANVQLVGTGGDDVLSSQSGDNILDGGLGQDYADYSAAGLAVNADLEAGLATLGADWQDMLIEIEHVIGTGFDDTIAGNGADNQITGGAGSDIFVMPLNRADATVTEIAGGYQVVSSLGTDTLITVEFIQFLDQTLDLSTITAPPAGPTPGNDVLSGTAGDDTVDLMAGDDSYSAGAGNDSVQGNAGNDMLFGDSGEDTLEGGAGNDMLQGGAGSDNLIGGDGTDTADYSDAPESIRVDLANSSLNLRYAAGDTYDSIENLIGTFYSDNLRGDGGENEIRGGVNVDWIFGRAGGDTLYGEIGNDVLIGGAGADTLYGGLHLDRAQYFTQVLVDLADPGRNTGEAAGDVYFSIEDLAGSKYDDQVYGDGAANRLFGKAGDDEVAGRGGNDYLNGGLGADTLDGGAGNDTLRGGPSGDTFVFNDGADVIQEFRSAQGDTIALDISELGLAGLSAAQIVSTYASTATGEVVFDFGSGDTLTLENVTTTAGLAALIDLI